jgi:hypothetical protein
MLAVSASAFEAGAGDALHDLALEEQEDDQQRQRSEDGQSSRGISCNPAR